MKMKIKNNSNFFFSLDIHFGVKSYSLENFETQTFCIELPVSLLKISDGFKQKTILIDSKKEEVSLEVEKIQGNQKLFFIFLFFYFLFFFNYYL